MRVYAVSPFKFHRFYLAWGHYAERKKSYAKLEIPKGNIQGNWWKRRRNKRISD